MERAPWWRPLAFVLAVGGGALALYLIHPLLSGYRLPVGPDGPVYTWLARHAAVAGFGDVPGGGPGVPAVTLTLGTILGTAPVQTVYLLGPILAVVSGLAGAAALETALGPNPWRAAAGAALTSAFAAYLAGGWLANVALVAAMLAAVAALALAPSSWRPVLLAGALIAAAGFAHRLFLVASVAILLLAAAFGAGAVRRAVAGGSRLRDTGPFREAAAVLGGGAVAAAVLAWVGAGPRLDVDTSQDGFLRRRGLRGLLVDRYRERFLGDLRRTAIPLVGGFGLTGAWLAEPEDAAPGATFLRRVVVAWASVTVVGVAILAATSAGPPSRALQFAFFLPLAAAAGVTTLGRRGRGAAWVGAALVALFVWVSLAGWARQAPAFHPGELRAVRAASAAVASLPDDAPIVFLVDTDELAAAYHVTRAGNVIRSAVDAERIPHVEVVVGRPDDHLADRPTLTGDPEHDAIARAYRPGVEGAPVLVLRELNPGFDEALARGTEVAPGVVLLEGSVEPAEVELPPSDPSLDGLEPGLLALAAPAALVVLGLLGAGWSLWALGSAGTRAALLAAPSVGLAVAILGAVGAERAGVTPGGPGSLAAVVALALLGHALARRR